MRASSTNIGDVDPLPLSELNEGEVSPRPDCSSPFDDWQNSHLQSAQHLMLNLYQKNNSSKFQWMLYFKNLSSKKMIKIPSKPIQLFTKGVWFHRSLGFSWSSREHSDPFKGLNGMQNAWFQVPFCNCLQNNMGKSETN